TPASITNGSRLLVVTVTVPLRAGELVCEDMPAILALLPEVTAIVPAVAVRLPVSSDICWVVPAVTCEPRARAPAVAPPGLSITRQVVHGDVLWNTGVAVATVMLPGTVIKPVLPLVSMFPILIEVVSVVSPLGVPERIVTLP